MRQSHRRRSTSIRRSSFSGGLTAQLEMLEHRRVPAALVTFIDGALSIVANGDEDCIDLSSDSDGIIRLNGDVIFGEGDEAGTIATLDNTTSVLIDGGQGNDCITTEDLGIFPDFGDPPVPVSIIILGGSGNDVIRGGDNDERIDAGSSNDIVCAGRGDDIVFGNIGDDQIDGEFGDDALFGGAGDDTLVGDEGDDDLIGGSGNDRMRGGNGDDFLQGDSGSDILCGEDGADVLLGGDGVDRADGGEGIDTFNGGAGTDLVVKLTTEIRISAERLITSLPCDFEVICPPCDCDDDGEDDSGEDDSPF